MSDMQFTPQFHHDDPVSSVEAAEKLRPETVSRLMEAIIEILREEPRAPFQVQKVYESLWQKNRWPNVQPHSVQRRISQLKKANKVRATGDRVVTPDGSTAMVLEVA